MARRRSARLRPPAHRQADRPLEAAQTVQGGAWAAEVREVRFHDLRHTFGTRMAAQGIPMRALQEMMGHRDFKEVVP
jgi:integrase